MSSAERKSIINVLILYLTSTILLVSIIAYNYYHYQKEQVQIKEKSIMEKNVKIVFSKLQNLHKNQSYNIIYPRFKEFNSAIYDIDKNLIFSTLKNSTINLKKNFIIKMTLYILYMKLHRII